MTAETLEFHITALSSSLGTVADTENGIDFADGVLVRLAEAAHHLGLQIVEQRWLSAQPTGIHGYACVELLARNVVSANQIDPAKLREGFRSLAETLGIDIVLLPADGQPRVPRLVAFDMDSTLIQGEVIDELARLAGVGEQVSAVTAAAMRGELPFQESFRRRVALLKGLPEAEALSLLGKIPLMPGTERLFRALNTLRIRTVILSGGFTFFGTDLQRRLGISEVHANVLDIRNGQVTGEISGEIVDGAHKAELLSQIAECEGIRLSEVAAVGDGANDLPMLRLVGLGVAFHAKPLVRASAMAAVSRVGLDALLYLFGLTDLEQNQLAVDATRPLQGSSD